MNNTLISALQDLCSGTVPEGLDKRQIISTPDTGAAEAAVKAAFPEARTTDGDLLLMDLEAAYEDLGFLNGFRLGVQLMAECMK